ncbi:transposase [Stappia aggregata IAM 12614]|uniref:Transposase n=1 Tax=Roseibium aggregatum (strain ATCC 25650 / DSM 13394 / JCM 20685 / NBRC 16684 / NCIMB 2208 / IAM 12614 / B1) TaxID=384765 RepID=A0NLJ7_ROSAI|nr:IS110 family transposase [Roseibium aggregatum]EAV40209.1 transposase [Stappia aggregata IAM 12614] [Roseibium aggregatum IAM 12614]EAV40522.1 transposase [Stappia aggregata IAM 12614] [Roseibium aggregatum IAM 12614]EAV40692.1 transposase [Stappia aggregata IAM 12614] [Roseibium aggregatum IAM 12614]EAV40859.1 transposase [Stappia aggregata IAM 12614] [Roseibium aggregatum IAM 12614]EAV41419.1 transposase [Stappia aggregata IAM 12614] [Roseibium aggregatum IAM 12614]
MDQYHDANSTAYVAIELSKRSWIVGIAHPDRDKPSIHRLSGGDTKGLLRRLAATHSSGRMIICFEAGHDGFWLARFLIAQGFDVRVLDPASLQVNRRARRVKTDRIDALAMLRALAALDRGERHVCAQVRILSVEEEDARRSHRERDRLIHERTAHVNRIKGLLFAQGIRDVEPRQRRNRIDFTQLQTAEGHRLPRRLLAELKREYARLIMVEDQLREVEKERDTADAQSPAVEQKRLDLEQLHGIGGTASAILAREVFARTFASRRHLASYLGLTPSAYDSGTVTKCQGISKAGNAWARRILIEIAWLWIKYQPDSPLSRWYLTRTQGQGGRMRRIMLIALARKLAIVLWRYVETGVLPERARLSPTMA